LPCSVLVGINTLQGKVKTNLYGCIYNGIK
jgi:hypothetical protein